MNITPVRSASYFPYLIEIDMIRRIKLELLEISWKDSHFSFIFLDAFYWSLDVLQLAFKVKPSFQNDIPSFITMITMDPMKMSAPLGHSISYCSFFFCCWRVLMVFYCDFHNFLFFFFIFWWGGRRSIDYGWFEILSISHHRTRTCTFLFRWVCECVSFVFNESQLVREKRELEREKEKDGEEEEKKKPSRLSRRNPISKAKRREPGGEVRDNAFTPPLKNQLKKQKMQKENILLARRILIELTTTEPNDVHVPIKKIQSNF